METMNETTYYLVLGVFFVGIFVLVSSIRIIQQYEKGLVSRLGRYARTVDSGIAFLFPFIEALIKTDMREQIINVPPQKVITKDNVSVLVDAAIYFKVIDPVKAEFEIQDFGLACTTLAQTNLRNLIGDQSLDETLTARDVINTNLRDVLDTATDSWGVKVTRVEVQKINPPSDITEAMSKQMKAEREKRAVVLEAEGVRQAEILRAEGLKQSEILRAEGDAQAQLLRAEAEGKATETISNAAEKFFHERAEAMRRLNVLESTLKHNTKLVLPANSPVFNLLNLDKELTDAVAVPHKEK